MITGNNIHLRNMWNWGTILQVLFSRYPVRVELGMIVVVYNDGSPASVFPITRGRLVNYWAQWLQRLAKYKQIKDMEF